LAFRFRSLSPTRVLFSLRACLLIGCFLLCRPLRLGNCLPVMFSHRSGGFKRNGQLCDFRDMVGAHYFSRGDHHLNLGGFLVASGPYDMHNTEQDKIAPVEDSGIGARHWDTPRFRSIARQLAPRNSHVTRRMIRRIIRVD
jgi:hypothetical protein